MKRTLLMLVACMATGLTTSACTINTSELEDALKLPEVTPEVKASFESAVSTVTAQVIDAAMDAAEDATTATAPAFSKQALRRLAEAQTAQAINVNATKATDDGGTITVTGTIRSSGTDASGSINLDLKADWTNLTVNDGTATQKTTGSETITGTISWTTDTFAMDLKLKGSFALGSENYSFDITMTMQGDKIVYSGTVNGQTVTGNVPVGDDAQSDAYQSCTQPGQSQVCQAQQGGGETCSTYDYDFCIEFADSKWTSTDIGAVCGSAPRETGCASSGLVGICAGLKDGKSYKYYSYSIYDKTKEDCEGEGGVWTGNN